MKTFKQYLAVKLCLALVLMTTACGGETINGKFYNSYGLANEKSQKDPRVLYEISASSVIWGILLCETMVIPAYIVGWDLYKPVRVQQNSVAVSQ